MVCIEDSVLFGGLNIIWLAHTKRMRDKQVMPTVPWIEWTRPRRRPRWLWIDSVGWDLKRPSRWPLTAQPGGGWQRMWTLRWRPGRSTKSSTSSFTNFEMPCHITRHFNVFQPTTWTIRFQAGKYSIIRTVTTDSSQTIQNWLAIQFSLIRYTARIPMIRRSIITAALSAIMVHNFCHVQMESK